MNVRIKRSISLHFLFLVFFDFLTAGGRSSDVEKSCKKKCNNGRLGYVALTVTQSHKFFPRFLNLRFHFLALSLQGEGDLALLEFRATLSEGAGAKVGEVRVRSGSKILV